MQHYLQKNDHFSVGSKQLIWIWLKSTRMRVVSVCSQWPWWSGKNGRDWFVQLERSGGHSDNELTHGRELTHSLFIHMRLSYFDLWRNSHIRRRFLQFDACCYHLLLNTNTPACRHSVGGTWLMVATRCFTATTWQPSRYSKVIKNLFLDAPFPHIRGWCWCFLHQTFPCNT